MPRRVHIAILFSSALFLGTGLGALLRSAHADSPRLISAPAEHAGAVSEAPPPPEDPKRKKAGEPCKSNDECQKHHSCAKDGDTSVCKAPAPRRLPPGAVT